MLYIGIDLGTSAVKLLLMDEQGKILNIISRAYPLEFPNPGWSQQNPADWRKAVLEGIPALLEGFDKEQWDKACDGIVKRGNQAKFSQNPELKEFLLKTGKRILVEASPRDRIWGIGMGRSNPDAENPLKWKGTNLLGFALTEVRDGFLEKGGAQTE